MPVDEPWVPPPIGATASVRRVFTLADVRAFAELSGDHNPLHFDADLAARTTFGRLIVHGGLTTGLFNALVAEQLPGPGSVFLHQEWDYPAAVPIGEEVTAEVEVIDSRGDKPVTRLRCRAWLADGTEVLRGESVVYTVCPSEG
jgi:acyl dehydratase